MSAPFIRIRQRGGGSGPGSPAVLLGAALGTSTALWEGVIAQLGAEPAILAWELPGHAGTESAPAAFDLADLADALASSLREAGLGPVVAAGVSVGGAVSLELGLRHPDLVSDVVMVCSALAFGTPAVWQERAAATRANGTASFRAPSAGLWVSQSRLSRPEVQRLLDHLERVDDESYALLCEAIGRYDARERVAELRPALHHVRGADDVLITEAAAQEIRSLVPAAALTVLEDARHISPIDQPVALAALLSEVLRLR